MATKIKFRRDTAAKWTLNNPVLAESEKGYEKVTKKWKIGDGVTPWNSLHYEVTPSNLQSLSNAITAEAQTRSDNDTALADAIASEAETRGDNYSIISHALSDEIDTRIEADSALQALLEDEATKRTDADDNLENLIAAENEARNDADANLQTDIDSRIKIVNIVDDLITSASNKPLSAKQGVELKALISALASVRKLIGDIDCSANPNFPAATKGDTYEVTVAGKIGGINGIEVEVWDEVVCKTNNAGGSFASVGSSWYVIQGNVLGSTESISGTIRKASQAEADAGTSDVGAVTPSKLAQWWTNVKDALFEKVSRKDATGGYVGLTLFKINFKNALNTITSFFTNANTAARTYTFQDRNGTIADDTDLATKQNTNAKDVTGGYAGLTLLKINFLNVANTWISFFTNSNTAARTYTFQDKTGIIAHLDDIPAAPTKMTRKIYAQSITETTGTATLTEELLAVFTIAAGEVVDGDSINIETLCSYIGATSSQKVFKIKVDTSASGNTGTTVGHFQENNAASVLRYIKVYSDIKCKAASGITLEAAYNTGSPFGMGVMTNLANANINLAATWYIKITSTKATTGDTMTFKYANIFINKQ